MGPISVLFNRVDFYFDESSLIIDERIIQCKMLWQGQNLVGRLWYDVGTVKPLLF